MRRLESIGGLAVRASAGGAAGSEARSAASPWRRGAVPVRRRVRGRASRSGWTGGSAPTSRRACPQIGAPEVWQGGHDGTGVTVAVLDTGVDAAHPALAGAIAESRSFTEDPDTGDRAGHGTHVASTSRRGSAPGVRGVAPGATLLNGKVLGDAGGGSCRGSSTAWSGRPPSAERDVVNLSLGAAAAARTTRWPRPSTG